MSSIEVISDQVTVAHLLELAAAGFGDLVKAVVDVERGIIAVGGDMHADEEALLLGVGSRQDDLWGVNLYPGEYGGSEWLEFDSMINVRPRLGNRSRSVDDPVTRARIEGVVARLVTS